MGNISSGAKRLISHTGAHKKIIINMDIAEKQLDKDLLSRLHSLLVELNHVQETKLTKNK